jgi:UDP-2-acetamido-2,6-beta-L-arabino-hexul-4-ose reductase
MRVLIEELTVRRDLRGAVFEPLEGHRLPEQRNVHVVLTEPGGIRGNHYHRYATEVATVAGPTLVRYREGEHIEDRIVAEGEVVMFRFPPGVPHALRNIGEKENLLVVFSTDALDRAAPDVVREVLIER